MGFFSSVIDPGGVFGGKPLHESLLGNSSEKAAQAQVQSALSAEQLQRRQFNTLREDAAPLRELRNAELGRVNKLLESSGGIGFEDSPEFINVRNAARSVGAGAPTRVRNALMDRAENLAMGQRDRFLNRILTTAGISSQGLNSTNRLLQDNVNARSALFDRAGESAASGIIGASNQKNQALTGLGGLLGAFAFSDPALKENIVQVGTYRGYPWYQWNWRSWAKSLVGDQVAEGVLSTDVLDINPDAVDTSGEFHKVNYACL